MRNSIKLFAFLLSAAALMAILFNSCDKKTIDITLEKEYIDSTFIIAQTAASGDFNESKSVTLDIATLAASKGFNVNDIKSAKLKSCTLTIKDTSAVPVTFDLIDNVAANFSANGIPVVEVASETITHNGASSVDLPLKDVELMNFVKAQNFNFEVKGHTNGPVPHDVPMRAFIKFSIIAPVLGKN